ncbi:hypothetical protein Sango_0328900 [Sesamum angolense]|uniref:ARM repeat superfamily protein n=1 Tax=Sesamum angolense TaxID=2727404 RepID=A0AAE2C399_9LAMI|nr:hypothetical protein Sango_0328900 [Sesamum angolense]
MGRKFDVNPFGITDVRHYFLDKLNCIINLESHSKKGKRLWSRGAVESPERGRHELVRRGGASKGNETRVARATSPELRKGMCRLAARGPRSRAEVRRQRVGVGGGTDEGGWGKEALLNALSALCTSCHETISALNPDAPSAILSLVSSACTKKAQKYREAAFCCLEQVIEAFNNPEFFNMVFPSLLEMGKSLAPTKPGQISSASDDKADEPGSSPAALHDKILSCVTACIHVASIRDILEQQKNFIDFYLFSLSPSFSWTVKMSVFSSTKELCSKLHSSANNLQDSSTHTSITAFVHELFYTLTPELLKSLRTVKIGQVHIAAAECLLALTNQYTASPPAQWTELSFMTELLDLQSLQLQAKGEVHGKQLFRRKLESERRMLRVIFLNLGLEILVKIILLRRNMKMEIMGLY